MIITFYVLALSKRKSKSILWSWYKVRCLSIIWAVGLLLFCQNATSQKQDIVFRHITSADGLSQNHVLSIEKDYLGFMWFGTNDGLNKYNGYDITVYKNEPDDSKSISNNTINVIYEEVNHRLWIGTNSGLNLYNREADNFVLFKHGPDDDSTISHNQVNTIYEDKEEVLWVGTADGLNKYNEQNATFTRYDDAESIENIIAIFEDSQNNLWLGTTSGLVLFNRDTKEKRRYTDFTINDIEEYDKGNLLIGTLENGLLIFDVNKKEFIKSYLHDPYDPKSVGNNFVKRIHIDKHDDIWIGTENGGLNKFNQSKGSFTRYINDIKYENSISNNTVSAIYEDEVGTMWVGVHRGGINYFNTGKENFKTYKQIPCNEGLNNNNINGFCEGDNGNIWIATDGGGLNVLNVHTQKFKYYMSDPNDPYSINSNVVMCVYRGSQGDLWLGTYLKGLNRFDREKGKFTHYMHDPNDSTSISHNNVWEILEDDQNRIWVGTRGNGISVYDRDNDQFKQYPHNSNDSSGISAPLVSDILQDSRGNIWIATTNGLNLYNSDTDGFSHYFHNEEDSTSLSDNFVVSLYQDQKGNFWVGTHKGLNLFNYDEHTFKVFKKADGLPNSVVRSIFADDHGNLWLGTYGGLSKFNPESGTFKNFFVDDGLQSNEFSRNAAIRTSDGKMYFGGISGVNMFHPDSVEDNLYKPPVYITEFRIFNESVKVGEESVLHKHISVAKEINLNYDQSVFTLEFAALNYLFTHKNQYKYKLEGFDKTWHTASHKRTATYTNLDPGKYTFKLKASNNDGLWNRTGTELIINIAPPYWKTWYFRVLVILIFIGILVFAYWIRMKVMSDQNKALEEQVKSKTSELELSNSFLLKSNQELDQFAYVVSHDLKTPLRGINNLSEWIETDLADNSNPELKQNLGMMRNRVDRMQKLINGLLYYSRIGKENINKEEVDLQELVQDLLKNFDKPEGFAISIENELPTICTSSKWMNQVFHHLLSNAIKYHNKSTGTIKLKYLGKNDRHRFEIEDDGPGIAEQFHKKIFTIFQTLQTKDELNSTGIGLTIVRKIIEEQGGKIWVESDGKNGSRFIFELPKHAYAKIV